MDDDIEFGAVLRDCIQMTWWRITGELARMEARDRRIALVERLASVIEQDRQRLDDPRKGRLLHLVSSWDRWLHWSAEHAARWARLMRPYYSRFSFICEPPRPARWILTPRAGELRVCLRWDHGR